MTLSLVVTFAVPFSLIMPAISMTQDDESSLVVNTLSTSLNENGDVMLPNAFGESGNEVGGTIYSPAEMYAKTLLIGEGDGVKWAEDCITVDDVIEKAKGEYFLGIAHDFCAFIENDFNPKSADAEGRVAVGGDFTFVKEGNEWNYQVGSGDYGSSKPLNNTIYYQDIRNFAHAIVGGKILNVNTASTGSGVKKFGSPNAYDATSGYHTVKRGDEYGYTFFYKPEEDLFKRLVVGNVDDSYHYEYGTNASVPYSSSHSHDYPGDCEVDGDGVDKDHPYLGSVNELAQIYKQPEGGLINFNEEFNYLRKRSKDLSKVAQTGTVDINGRNVTLTCPEGTKEGDTVYFNIPHWVDDEYDSINFVNVPTGILNDAYGEPKTYPTCNLIVNCGGTNFQIGQSGKSKVSTCIDGEDITLYDGTKNNHPASEKILYNFYEATTGTIQTNFNGTVFAPFADVDTPPGADGESAAAGHLSGALIAKSFTGYLEFGYRPYRGTSDILGLTSGYSVPIDKLITGTDEGLPDAYLSAVEITPGVDNPYHFDWISSGGTIHVPFPTGVDFSGKTHYTTTATTTTTITSTTTTTASTTTTVASAEADAAAVNADDNIVQQAEPTETASSEADEPDTQPDIAVDDSGDAEAESADNLIEINKSYEITETAAPEGFIKVDNKYYVYITEKVDLQNVIPGQEGDFPCHVITTIEIQNNENSVIANWTLDITSTYSDKRVSSREIKVLDDSGAVVDSFQVDIDYNKQQVTKVSHNGTDLGLNISKEQTITIGGQSYYYDPDVIMVMPLPESNLEFENTPGLLFKKVDDSGNDVTGAVIQLLDSGSPITDTSIWNWDNTKNSFLIDVSKLVAGKTYTFHEESAPSTYEKAEDIHFELINATTVNYWTGDEKPENPSVLDLTKEQTIRMVDNRKLGAVPSLKKVHKKLNDDGTVSEELVILSGATIELHAQNGDFICKWENFSGEETSMKEALAAAGTTAYTENGYLKPGVYYLSETVIPKCSDDEPHDDPGKMYFTVKSDFTIFEGYSSVIELKTTNPTGNKVFFNLENPDVIKNVNYFHVKANEDIQQMYDVGSLSGDTNRGKDFQHSFETPESWDLTKNSLQFQNWSGGLTVTYIEIRTSDGITYVYGTNPNQSEDSSDANDDHTNKYLEVTDLLLQVENIRQGDTKDIEVEKNWAGDERFTSFRSDVTYKLYSTTEDLTDLSQEALQKLVDEHKAAVVTVPASYTDDEGNTKTQETTLNLSEANNWTQKIHGLPTKSNETDQSGKKLNLNYFIIEDEISGYTPSYTITGNTLKVTNTLETISLDVKKIWQDTSGVPKPDSLTLQLQMKNGETWENIKSVTLRGDSWTTSIEGLPAGKSYRIVENVVPNGWKCMLPDNASSPIDTSVEGYSTELSITNEPKVASLIVQKLWASVDDESQRPKTVRVKIYRTAEPPSDLLPYPVNQSPEATQQDYARLLQYSLYFYDGNMCGDEVNENSAYSWRGDCHTCDATNGGVIGGFHDAGDHVMFGLPQGYTASILSWGLYEFPGSYNELNQTPHLKTLIDYFCKFINQCVHYNGENIDKILVQKGNPTTDHSYWGVPEVQEERGSDEIWWDSDGCADIAYEYAAALTSAYMNAKDGNFGILSNDEMSVYDGYLETAKKLFQFADRCNNKQSESKVETTCYKSWSWEDDRSWAATWLRLATNDSSYNTYLNTNVSSLNVSWDSVGTAAALLNAGHINDSQKSSVADSVYSKIPNNDDYLFGGDSGGGWGNMRHNAAYQMTALVAAKYQSDTSKKQRMTDWAKAQMAIILGNNNESGNEAYTDRLNQNNKITGFDDTQYGNSKNHIRERTCFVTNFSKDTLLHPHYRATCDPAYSKDMGGKDNAEIINGYDLDKNYLIGGLAGGWDQPDRVYRDERSIYTENEVAIDYNACFVGAAAGLWDAYHTGHTYLIPESTGVKTQYVTSDTKPGEYYEIAQPAPQLQTLSEFPMAMMSMTKSIRAAESGRDENGFYYTQEQELNGENWVSIPVELSGKKITKIVVYCDSDQANGAIGYQYKESWGVASNRGNFNGKGPSNIDINIDTIEKPISNVCLYTYSGIFTVTEVRFYYQPDNTFTITSSSPMLIVGDTINIVTPEGVNVESWTAEPDVLTFVNNAVTAKGNVTQETTVKITAKATIDGMEKTGECQITVSPFEIKECPGSVSENSEFTIKTNASVSEWTFDDSKIQYISSNGNEHKFKALDGASGTVTITAKHGERSATKEITVNQIQFAITPSSCDLPINETVTLTANAPATWTADTENVQLTPGADGKTCVVKALNGANTSAKITATRTANASQTAEATIHIQPKQNIHKWVIDNPINTPGNTLDLTTVDALVGNKITKIEVHCINGQGGANGIIFFNGNQVNNKFTANSFPYVYEVASNLYDSENTTSATIFNWYGLGKTEVWFYYEEAPKLEIIPEKTTDIYPGDKIKLDITGADAGVTWDSNANGAFTQENGSWYFTPKKSGEIKISGASGSLKGSCTINVNPIQVSPNPIKLHVKTEGMPDTVGTQVIASTPDDITFGISDSSIASISGKTITANAAVDTTLTMTRNGVLLSETIPVKVLEPLTITGITDMNPNTDQTLTVQNNIGNVEWSIKDGSVEAEITKDGKLISTAANGKVTVVATDTDGSTSEFIVNVHSVAVIPEIPEDAEEVDTIDLTKDKGWTETVGNLPVTDENGRPYYYYIVEVDENGIPLTTADTIKGNGAIYIPVDYSDNNGSQLSEDADNPTNLSVKNENIGETKGELPSAGGEGTAKYYLTGMIIICSAAAYYLIRRRKRNAVK